MCPGALVVETTSGHSRLKNSASTFRAPDAPECTMWPANPIRWKKQVGHNMSRCTFCEIHTSPTRAWNIVCQRFTPQTHQNALCDPQIPSDAKIQVWCNVSRRAFCGIRTGVTWAWKIVHRRFTAQIHHNALCDPQIPLDAKTQVQRNVLWCAFCGICTSPTRAWKIVHRCYAARTQKQKFGVTCSDALFKETAPGAPMHKK
jgi:hypothetical protein